MSTVHSKGIRKASNGFGSVQRLASLNQQDAFGDSGHAKTKISCIWLRKSYQVYKWEQDLSGWVCLGLNCEAKQQFEPLMKYGYNRCQEKSHNRTDTKITTVGNRQQLQLKTQSIFVCSDFCWLWIFWTTLNCLLKENPELLETLLRVQA